MSDTYYLDTPDPEPGAGLYLIRDYDSMSDVLDEFGYQLVDEFGVRAEYAHGMEQAFYNNLDLAPAVKETAMGATDDMNMDIYGPANAALQGPMYPEAPIDVFSGGSDSEGESTPSSTSAASKNKVDEDTRPDFHEAWVRDPRAVRPEKPLGENEVLAHKIEWVTPPRWAGEVVPKMPVSTVLGYLNEKYQINKSTRCMVDGCDRSNFGNGGLKNHLKGKDHFHIRTHCLTCKFEARPDIFTSRHKSCRQRAAANAAALQKVEIE